VQIRLDLVDWRAPLAIFGRQPMQESVLAISSSIKHIKARTHVMQCMRVTRSFFTRQRVWASSSNCRPINNNFMKSYSSSPFALGYIPLADSAFGSDAEERVADSRFGCGSGTAPPMVDEDTYDSSPSWKCCSKYARRLSAALTSFPVSKPSSKLQRLVLVVRNRAIHGLTR
jgi:hypothetical protein